MSSSWVGANAAYLFTAYPVGGAAWTAHLDAMQAAGVGVVRFDVEWGRVEPSAPVGGVHTYDWTLYDEAVRQLAKRGIRAYMVIDYSAPWAGAVLGATRTPPANNSDFATYARALALRYGTNGGFWRGHPTLAPLPVDHWEVWNEQNGGYFWPPGPDAVKYTDLYTKARNNIRAVDPAAKVVVGGLINHNAVAFLNGMLAAGVGAMDAVGLHAYANDVAGVQSWVSAVEQALAAAGRPGVPVEMTEVGWTTQVGYPLATDAQRAQLITDLLPALRADPLLTRCMLYSWTSREQFAQGYDWYGLYAPDGSPNASGLAFAAAITALGASA